MHLAETPIIRDMRTTARELGVIDLLADVYRTIRDWPGADAESVLILEAMMRLGATLADVVSDEEADARDQGSRSW